jgi:hypothetical protein
MFHIYTCSNSQYFNHLQGLLYSFKGLTDSPYHVFIIDIGLTPNQIHIINTLFNFLVVSIIKPKRKYLKKDMDSYLFKIDAFEMMLNDSSEYAIWQDAKNHFKMSMSHLKIYLDQFTLIINLAGVKEEDFTSHITLKKMNINDSDRETQQFQATGLAIKKNETGKKILEDIVKYGNDPECLAPIKSSKLMHPHIDCHRQDQSIVSLVVKKYKAYKDLPFYSLHNTIHPT